MPSHGRTDSQRSIAASEFPTPALKQVVEEIAAMLKDRKETVSIAETAAGGLISATLLSVPGASAYYKGGLTLYTLESRKAFADWTQQDIDSYQGPTTGIVGRLADNVRARIGGTYCVSESGTAGPAVGPRGGQVKNRRPGYVAVAVSSDKGTFTHEVDTGLEDRESNMLAFAVVALTLLKEVMQGKAPQHH